ncbi:glutamate receptor 2.7-like protein [Cinnamomum micranthum f. kanehirae]|uniref:Glutamate receptor 2.7-like protein n=1 Tax=Cinnamomum micranthum f. kanehirae TaxID=337451 RepID=A0A443NA02_9MAGN|nr:glutamate receptor 2.7-like protein [Cinnamomum micranthum f. kanehirae]
MSPVKFKLPIEIMKATLFSSFLLLFSLNLVGRCSTAAQNKSLNARISFDVGIVLDLESTLGKMSKVCISIALDDFYTTHNNYNTKLILHWRDSNEDDMEAASMVMFLMPSHFLTHLEVMVNLSTDWSSTKSGNFYFKIKVLFLLCNSNPGTLDLLNNVRVKAIIGPQTSAQAQFVAELVDKYHVPMLSFSATSPFISSIRTPYFIRTALSDFSQVNAIAAIIKAFGWREVIQIWEDTLYGNGVIRFLTDALQEVDTHVSYRYVISQEMTNDEIAQELYKLKKIQTRVFIVHSSPSLNSHLFFKANELGMMSEGFVWIVTDGVASFLDSMNSSVIQTILGVLGVRPYVQESNEMHKFTKRWKRKFLNDNPSIDRAEINIFGLWAYDTVCPLANAAEEAASKYPNLMNTQTRHNSNELVKLGVSEMGPSLRDAILKTNFKLPKRPIQSNQGATGSISLPNSECGWER